MSGGIAGTVYWKLTPSVTSMDAWDHVIDETLGNGVRTISGFDAVTSWLGVRQTSTSGHTNDLQNLSYQWDKNGNLSQRQDLRQSITEAFTHDSLNRVTDSTRNGAANLYVRYLADGNIDKKGDGATGSQYNYADAAHKHALTSVTGGGSYGYDPNGNMTSRAGATISWASFNLPTVINGGGLQSTFSYGPDRERKQQTATYSKSTETTVYVGGLMEKVTTSSATMYKHLIATPSGTRVVVTRTSSGTSVAYVSTDHLGSSDTITDAAGGAANAVRLSFTAFGQRRGSDWTLTTPPDWTGIATTTRHGFTQHEHLDNLALIHMNGRVYDPVIGRFLSADPIPGLTCKSQSWNPYSYVMNRPLRSVDPTGWFALPDPYGAPIDTVMVNASRQNRSFGNFSMGGGVGGLAGGVGGRREAEPPGSDDAIGDLGGFDVVGAHPTASLTLTIVFYVPEINVDALGRRLRLELDDRMTEFSNCMDSCKKAFSEGPTSPRFQ